MPITTVQVSEFECMHCGHKWINRVNGKDGPISKKCAKCKRKYWNGWDQKYESDHVPITPKERSLRMRLYKFEGTLNRALGYGTQYRPNELCRTFLNLKPRPTMHELSQALWPLGWDPHKRKNMIPHPDKPGYLTHDTSRLIRDPEDPDNRDKMKYNSDPDFFTDYQKLLVEESVKRKEIMKAIIKSRRVEFQEPKLKIKVKSKFKSEENKEKDTKTYNELLEEIRGKMKKPK